MGSPDALIRATVNRLGARLGHGLADAAAELAVLALDAPERLRQVWDLLLEEVQAEAERLEHGETITADGAVAAPSQEQSSQDRIDLLRATVAESSRALEVKP